MKRMPTALAPTSPTVRSCLPPNTIECPIIEMVSQYRRTPAPCPSRVEWVHSQVKSQAHLSATPRYRKMSLSICLPDQKRRDQGNANPGVSWANFTGRGGTTTKRNHQSLLSRSILSSANSRPPFSAHPSTSCWSWCQSVSVFTLAT